MNKPTLTLVLASAIGASALIGMPAWAKGQRATVAVDCGAHSDPAACRKEAHAAAAAARQGQLTGGDFAANQLARCKGLPANFRETCQARVQNGQTTGSVEAGGTLTEYRELVTPK
jgi:hypothetical protein